jgi:uncharacterized protein with PIN domain
MAERFVVDMTVGKLAKWLRALGFDTAVYPGRDLHRLVQLSRRENRVIVTRNRQLEAKLFLGNILILKENEADRQIAAVIRAMKIHVLSQRFLSRCLGCNELLETVPRESVEGKVPEFVFHAHEVFHRCPACEKIYWEGTHPTNMKRRIEKILGSAEETRR